MSFRGALLSLEGKLLDEESAFRNSLIHQVQQILRCAQNDNFSLLPSIFNKLLAMDSDTFILRQLLM